jgi:hypothetical protein
MDREEVLAKAKRDFQFLQKRVLGTLVFGSWARGEASERSDIDLCIVAPRASDPGALWREALSNIQDSRYEVRIFELLAAIHADGCDRGGGRGVLQRRPGAVRVLLSLQAFVGGSEAQADGQPGGDARDARGFDV